MSGFYEWDNAKEKHYFTTDGVLFVAGFCRKHKTDKGIETESIIMTTSPNASVKLIHDCMPLIVKRSQVSEWILNLEFARDLIYSEMPNLKSELVS